MKHLGDITKINGAEIEPVDCICGGSPCQDLSVAGLRAGLSGERSGLFMEQIRIVKEMREHDKASGRTGESVRPRYMVWENVPGAFSSNGGKDFQAVLTEIVRIVEPEAPDVPLPDKGWPMAGFLCAADRSWSVAYKVHDAQFWGVPQRRKRICVLADLNGDSAGDILFDLELRRETSDPASDKAVAGAGAEPRSEVSAQCQGVSGDPEPGGEAREGSAGQAADSTGDAGCFTLKIRGGCEGGGKGALVQTEKSGTLSCNNDQTLFCLNDQGGIAICQPVVMQQNASGEVREGAVVGAISTNSNASGRNTPIVAYNIGSYYSNAWMSSNPDSGVYEADRSKTLDAINCGYPGCNQGGTAVVEPILLESNQNHATVSDDGVCTTLPAAMGMGGGYVPMITEAQGINGDVAGTPDASYYKGCGERQGVEGYVVLDMTHANDVIRECGDTVLTLQSRMGTGGNQVPLTYQDVTGALCANSHPGSYTGQDAYNDMLVANGVQHSVVRRLTPLECTRLQGFPDHWVDIGDWVDSKGKTHKDSDSAKYKALGNSIALPFWDHLLARISFEYDRIATLGSLFDGIGGFPYCFERIHGKGTALWASEIEEFPIAVTRKHFNEGSGSEQ